MGRTSAVRDVISQLRHRPRVAIAVAVFSAVSTAAEAVMLITVAAVASAFAAGHSGRVEVRSLGLHENVPSEPLLAVAVGLIVIRLVAEFGAQRIVGKVTTAYEISLRKDLLDAYLRADMSVQERYGTGELQTLALADSEGARLVLESSLRVLPAAIGFGLLLLTAFFVSPALSGAIVVAAALMSLLLQPLARRGGEANEAYSRSRGSWAKELVQNQALRREIRVFGIASWVEQRSQRLLDEQQQHRRTADILNAMSPAIYQSTIYVVAVGLLIVLATADIAVRSLASVVLLLVRALSYSQRAQQLLHTVDERAPNKLRLDETLAGLRAGAVTQGDAKPGSWLELAFENVTYSYDDGPPAINGLSFRGRRGEAIGFIGPSGAGKSTAILLALGLLRPDAGAVTIDGVAVDDISPDERARHCAFVPQEAVLFELPISENITLGRPGIDAATIAAAAREAWIASDIEQLPDGFETVAAERGSRFSLGQRQRITIARAVAGRPNLVVFDEPTSALDPVSESAINRVIDDLRKDAIVLVVSHRRESAIRCDRVLYLEAGELVAEGDGAAMWERAGFAGSGGG